MGFWRVRGGAIALLGGLAIGWCCGCYVSGWRCYIARSLRLLHWCYAVARFSRWGCYVYSRSLLRFPGGAAILMLDRCYIFRAVLLRWCWIVATFSGWGCYVDARWLLRCQEGLLHWCYAVATFSQTTRTANSPPALQVYRESCSTGIVRTSTADFYRAKKLPWLNWW